MSQLLRGLYEAIISEELATRLSDTSVTGELRDAEAADRLALHLARVVERTIKTVKENERAEVGAQLTRHLVEALAGAANEIGVLAERPVAPPRVLRAVRQVGPDGRPMGIGAPLIPLLDSTLLTNSPGDPGVGQALLSEIASADRVDVIMAFVRRSGIRDFLEPFERHVRRGRRVRLLTTTYTGSTELDALNMLVDRGVDVRVSYHVDGTRLHAKSWIFHRNSGFSTAFVGSSNLTHSAQVTGLEWNVRLSGARNRPLLEKIGAVFESYWAQDDFRRFEPAEFATECKRQRTPTPGSIISPIEVKLWAFQERLLEQVELARQRGHHRNLLVAATGTGKTVMAAMDYARLRSRIPRARLLFVAHRQEILSQSRATFAHVLGDADFGEYWAAGERPRDFVHVFASIQSLTSGSLSALDPQHFDVVIVDEFHHAAARSYERLLKLVTPVELLGLTATPERGDGQSILHWFDGRIAAELRLWDAIDQGRLAPFAYYGIADALDLRDIPWKRGRGYDVARLSEVITGTDMWAHAVLREVRKIVGDVGQVRALGFCVSIQHAEYMARVFADAGVAAVAVSGESSDAERHAALRDLRTGRVNVVFSVDLFNEGVDLPAIDTLLMLRPTESSLLFLQQLGRGLRKEQGKAMCTVLDFVGQHRKEFRYDARFRALLGGTRRHVVQQIEQGFPFLPAGCHMELDRVARERVLESIKRAVPSKWPDKIAELRDLAAGRAAPTLAEFLAESGCELWDVYAHDRCWSDLRNAAGLASSYETGPHEAALRRSLGRLLHVDDDERLRHWNDVVRSRAEGLDVIRSDRGRRLVGMLLSELLDGVTSNTTTVREGLDMLYQHPGVRAELSELLDVLADRGISHLTKDPGVLPDVPLRVHARYTRDEILAACAPADRVQPAPWREGVRFIQEIGVDLFAFTLDKTSGQFSPTTRYQDYAINRELIHWESQSRTRAESRTGRRYQRHVSEGTHVMLFARVSAEERAFHFLGPATYVSHVGEEPMAITWRLAHPLPGDLFAAFAAAVA